MRSTQLSLPIHPLTNFLWPAAESITTSLSESSIRGYRVTIRQFLNYLGDQYPSIRSLDQLRRDPHLLGWLSLLRSRNPPLSAHSRARHAIYLRRMLEELAWTQQLPSLAHLLVPDDVPRQERRLPRPLTPEQDHLLQQDLRRRNDFNSNVLLLLRHTGMRIGECIDLSVDCLRTVGPDQWAIHVPLGKLKTERWVPVDSLVCQLVQRIRSLLPPDAPRTGKLLLPRGRGRWMLPLTLRAALQDAAAAVGITTRIVPHQFRHTYATELLRAGVTLAAVVKLLGHKSPHMTLHYLEITQADLQREYHLARAHPRHLLPSPPTLHTAPASADPKGILNSLQSAQHVMEMFRRTLPDGSSRHLLDRLTNRLTKIVAQIRKLSPPAE
jgi:site-specific recombinase XerD